MSTTTTSEQPTYKTLLTHLPAQTPILPSQSQAARNPSLTPLIASLELHPTLESLLHLMNSDLASAHFLVRHMQRPVPLAREQERNGQGGGKGVWTNGAAVNGHPKSGDEEGETEKIVRGKKESGADEAPRIEGMHLHALLHRLEGDYDNAEAWYRDCAAYSPPPSATSDETGATNASAAADEVSGTAQGTQTDRIYGDESTPPTIFTHAFRQGLPMPLSLLNNLRQLRSSSENTFQNKAEKQSQDEITRMREWMERRYGTGRWEDATGEFVGNSEKHREIASKMLVGGEGWRQF